jgi:hypothetical protein
LIGIARACGGMEKALNARIGGSRSSETEVIEPFTYEYKLHNRKVGMFFKRGLRTTHSSTSHQKKARSYSDMITQAGFGPYLDAR